MDVPTVLALAIYGAFAVVVVVVFAWIYRSAESKAHAARRGAENPTYRYLTQRMERSPATRVVLLIGSASAFLAVLAGAVLIWIYRYEMFSPHR